MPTTTTGRIRRADIRAAVARGAVFLDRAWPAVWTADVSSPITWWDCPLHQLGRVVDVGAEPADDPRWGAASALGLGGPGELGTWEELGFWFDLDGSERVDAPLIRAWERAWNGEIAARRRSPRPARVRTARPPRGPRSRLVRQ